MKNSAKSKWIIGISGAAFSAFILGQLNHPDINSKDISNKSENKLKE